MQRVLRLEQQCGDDRIGALAPAARPQRMHELLAKLGVAEHELETVHAALLAMMWSNLNGHYPKAHVQGLETK